MENILDNFKQHIGHSLVLLLFLLFGVTLFLAFSHDSNMRIILLTLVSVSYAVWGIVHHYIKKDLNWALVIEYTTFAFLAAVGAITLLGWGNI
jgi:hypothetical protein